MQDYFKVEKLSLKEEQLGEFTFIASSWIDVPMNTYILRRLGWFSVYDGHGGYNGHRVAEYCCERVFEKFQEAMIGKS